jgi:hypothetical protein
VYRARLEIHLAVSVHIEWEGMRGGRCGSVLA